MPYNPFTPTFGSEPLLLAGREKYIEDFLSGLENGQGDPNRSTIFTGPRGSGKTVLLSKIASEAAAIGWISANVTALPGMLNKVIEQVKDNAVEFLPKQSLSRITGIQVGGTGITREITAPEKPSWRKQMADIMNILQEENIGLLITIDEVGVGLDELIELVSDYQHFIREHRNVALAMAGLPNSVNQLLQDKSVSFLRRAFYRKLDPISIADVKNSMRKTIEISGRTIQADALNIMATQTEGFPFMIQLVGYHVWKQSSDKNIIKDDVLAGLDSAKEDMEHMIINTTIREISKVDLKFLLAMTDNESVSNISDIAAKMGVSQNYAAQYRRRLIEQGIIASVGTGDVSIIIPMLTDILKERYKNN